MFSTPSAIPFPSGGGPLSPRLSRPPSRTPTPPLYSLSRNSSSAIILSNGKPLKPSLKGASFPDLPDELRLHQRTKSEPSTPSVKSVHFRDEEELEEVRVYNRSGRPANLLSKAGEETETETELESAFPFPTHVPSGLEGAGSATLPASSSLMFDISPVSNKTSTVPRPTPDNNANVHLESISLPRTRPAALKGTVLVRNVSFEKNVAIRFTFDDWQTTSEVFCKHVVSLPSLPPPFPRSRTVGDVIGQLTQRPLANGKGQLPHEEDNEDSQGWDRFSFTVHLEDYAARLADKTLFIVVRYSAPGIGEWWDNNGNANYRVGFRCVGAEPAVSPLATTPPLMGVPAGKSQQKSFMAPSTLKTTPLSADVSHGAPQPVQIDKLAGLGQIERRISPRHSPRSSPRHSPRQSPRQSPNSSPNGSDLENGRRRHGQHPGSLGLGARPTFPRTMSSPPVFSPSPMMNGSLSPILARLSRLSLSNYAAPASPAASRLGVYFEDQEMQVEPSAIKPPHSPPPSIQMTDATPPAVADPPELQLLHQDLPEAPMLAPSSPGLSSRSSSGSASPVPLTPDTPLPAEGLPALPKAASTTSLTTPHARTRPNDIALPIRGSVDSPFSPVGTPLLALGGVAAANAMDTNHAEYTAFVRKWCFAQSPTPSGVSTPVPQVSRTSSNPELSAQGEKNAWLGMGEGYGMSIGVGVGDVGRV